MFEKIKTLTSICPICEAERKVHYGTKKETLNVRGENIAVNAKVFYCPEGDHFFSNLEYDEEKIQTVYREYRERKKILHPDEIKLIRDKYGLSQEAFSDFLGFGKKTIHRYENGAIPDGPHNSFMKLIQDTDNFQKHFNDVKDNLAPALKQKIEKQLLEFETGASLLLSAYISKPAIFEDDDLQTPVFIQASRDSVPHLSYSAVSIPLSNAEVGTGYEKYPDLSWGITTLKKKDTSDKDLALAA